MNCYPFIEAEKAGDHSVKRACELLQVSRSAYYAERTGGPSPRERRDAELTGKIIEIHDNSRHTYGSPPAACWVVPGCAGCPRGRDTDEA
ncbi:hypothetical protein E0H75_13330 [Kribbella capetownensis]|uniref:Transposase n=1 Tax=Kribbella capetownensis TaxID=1572659 RepID=A0A4V2M8D7_9ACTN|nr:hypothetical protein [Kribbella capetownensis]TCC51112.1 hypothetical protein E0H75_13330 [Kribbella capetownensis]